MQAPGGFDVDARGGTKQLRQPGFAVVARASVAFAGGEVRLIMRVAVLVVELVSSPDDQMPPPAVSLPGRANEESRTARRPLPRRNRTIRPIVSREPEYLE